MTVFAYLLEGLLIGAVPSFFVSVEHLSIIVLHNFDTMTLVLVRCLVSLDFSLCVFNPGQKLFLLVVELVFQR